MKTLEHSWVDGQDGIRYHCRKCGISKIYDYSFYDCAAFRKRNPEWRKMVYRLRSKPIQEKWHLYWTDLWNRLYDINSPYYNQPIKSAKVVRTEDVGHIAFTNSRFYVICRYPQRARSLIRYREVSRKYGVEVMG